MSLDKTIEALDKKFGKGTIMRFGDKPQESVEYISTGLPSLDEALGIGGLPKGRIVEIAGPESSGKTTCTLHLAVECQKAGGTVAFVDAEHALDPEYAKNLGLNMDEVLISQPDFGEQALEVVESLVRSEQVDLIIIDSVAALVPKSELEGNMGDSLPGLQARLMSQAMRKLTGTISKTKTLVVFINQLRATIGGYGNGPNETTTGGKALKFYASVRLDIRRIGSLKNGEEVIGNKTRIKIVKNKLAPPYRQVEFDIIFGEGISIESDVLDKAIEANVIEKSGAWFKFEGKNFAQGRENARKALKDEDFKAMVLDKMRP
jgi:recombination protein RecA